MDSSKRLGIHLSFDASHAAMGFNPTDLLTQRWVHQPQQGRHGCAVVEVRGVLDDCRSTPDPSNHNGEASRGRFAEHGRHRLDVRR